MKKRCLFLFAVCVMFSFVSCLNMEAEGSVSVSFKASDFLGEDETRTISVAPGYVNYYVVVSLLGDREENKTLTVQEGGTYTVTFDGIPAGVNAYIEADVYYFGKSPYIHLFRGVSQRQMVHGGENAFTVNMVNMQNVGVEIFGPYITDKLVGEETIVHDTSLKFYSNGKYQVKVGSNIVSEGLWTGSIPHYGKFYLTECVYKNYLSDKNAWGNDVIVENPKPREFLFYYQDDGVSGDCMTVSFLNGLKLMVYPS